MDKNGHGGTREGRKPAVQLARGVHVLEDRGEECILHLLRPAPPGRGTSVLQIAGENSIRVAGAGVVDSDAALLLEATDHGQEAALLSSGPRTQHRNRADGFRAAACAAGMPFSFPPS